MRDWTSVSNYHAEYYKASIPHKYDRQLRCYQMNVVFLEESPINACLCGCSEEKNSQKIAYTFSEGSHRLCIDKKYINNTNKR